MSDSNTSLAVIPHTFAEVSTLADKLSASGLLPLALRGKVPDVLMTIMAGQELGLPPIAALRSIHVIEGKTVLSADAMVAIVLARKAALYFKRISASDTEATYETLRVGEDKPQRVTWTIEMAKRAGVHLKDNWRLYPRAMLSARAKAELARDVYPDVLAGCYTAEEIDERNPPAPIVIDYDSGTLVSPKADAIDVDFVDQKSVAIVGQPTAPADASIDQLAADIINRIWQATTDEQLTPLAQEADKLPKRTQARRQTVEALKQQKAKIALAFMNNVGSSNDTADAPTTATVEAVAS